MFKKLLVGVVLAVSLALAAPASSQDRLEWFNDLTHDQQNSRLEAMELTRDRTFSATDDNFGKYLKRWLSKDGKGKRKSCWTGADRLMQELQADPVVGNEFDMKLYNTGVNIYGRSIPIPHFTIRMDPKNGIGPAYMADRYLGGVMAEIVEWEEADLTISVIEIYATVYPITESELDSMFDMIKPPVEPEPVIDYSGCVGWSPHHCVTGNHKHCHEICLVDGVNTCANMGG